MVGAVLNIMSDRIILNIIIDGRRYMLRTDRYNYIWQEGSAELDDESFLKQTRGNSYFRTLDALLRSVFNNSVRQGIVTLDTESILTAHQNALTTVSEIGEKLDKVSWGCLDRGIYCSKCQSKLKGSG